jgi:hypothetical protein
MRNRRIVPDFEIRFQDEVAICRWSLQNKRRTPAERECSRRPTKAAAWRGRPPVALGRDALPTKAMKIEAVRHQYSVSRSFATVSSQQLPGQSAMPCESTSKLSLRLATEMNAMAETSH